MCRQTLTEAADERQKTYIPGYCTRSRKYFFSANVHQCMYNSVNAINIFYLLLYFFRASKGSGYFNKAYLCFRLFSVYTDWLPKLLMSLILKY